MIYDGQVDYDSGLLYDSSSEISPGNPAGVARMGVQLGDEKTFRATLTMNGTVWTTPLASCQFIFVRPDGTSFTRNGTVENPITAVVSYTTVNTATYEIDEVGLWQLFVLTIDTGGNQLTMDRPHTFNVFGTA